MDQDVTGRAVLEAHEYAPLVAQHVEQRRQRVGPEERRRRGKVRRDARGRQRGAVGDKAELRQWPAVRRPQPQAARLAQAGVDGIVVRADCVNAVCHGCPGAA